MIPGLDLVKYGPWAFALVWAAYHAIRIVPENSRLVVYRLGRYLELRGPGIVFTVPIVEKTARIREGEEAVLIESNKMAIKSMYVPVRAVDNVTLGSPVRIHSFAEQEVLVVSKRNEENP